MPTPPPGEERKDGLGTRLLKRLNAFTELTVVYELSYVCFWCWQGIIGPVWAALLFAWWAIEGTCVRPSNSPAPAPHPSHPRQQSNSPPYKMQKA